MKYLFALLLLFPQLSKAQILYNTSCGTAVFLNDETTSGNATFDFTGQCPSGQTVLYYYFRANNNYSGTKVMTISAADGSTALNVGYSLYGPYDSQSNICTDMTGRGPVPIISGSSTSSQDIISDLTIDKTYMVKLTINSCKGSLILTAIGNLFRHLREEVGCMDCVTGFKPGPGSYILSAWVKDASASGSATNYTMPTIEFYDGITTTVCTSSGDIIDGWQRIEMPVTVGLTSTNVSIKLKCSSGGDCYFDDIRVHPVDATMVSYVYDPVSLRLMAELDERNYAKYYEYDEEGKLIRVKKETENGIMTIQETRENNSGQ